jgi:hypothetical protein
VEFQVALKQGYKIIKVHAIHQYNMAPAHWNPPLKELYIKKMASSGPTPPQEEQDRIERNYQEQFGMGQALRDAFPTFEYDAAKRITAKTNLNCGWGKHCQRVMLDTTTIVSANDKKSPALFLDSMAGNTIIKTATPLGAGFTMYKSEDNGDNVMPNLHNSYLPAGVFVPAYARLVLLEQMAPVGDRVLYYDTDSMIYIHDPALYNPTIGDTWGNWSEEDISKEIITDFVALGPKSYGLKTATGKELVKMKGVSLKHAHREMFNFDAMLKLLNDHYHNLDSDGIDLPQMNFKCREGKDIRTTFSQKKVAFKEEQLKGYLHKHILYPPGYCKGCSGAGINHVCN